MEHLQQRELGDFEAGMEHRLAIELRHGPGGSSQGSAGAGEGGKHWFLGRLGAHIKCIYIILGSIGSPSNLPRTSKGVTLILTDAYAILVLFQLSTLLRDFLQQHVQIFLRYRWIHAGELEALPSANAGVTDDGHASLKQSLPQ